MGRDERRSARKKASANVSRAKAYVAVQWDGKGFPIFRYDVSQCQNENIVQHLVMQQCAEAVETIVLNAQKAVESMRKMQEEKIKVQLAKDNRSKELGLVDEIKG